MQNSAEKRALNRDKCMSVKPQQDDNSQEIAEKVRSGEYFQEVRQMYDLAVHDPMAERYWFLLITVLSLLIAVVTFFAMQSLYPLVSSVPFIVNSNDIVDDLPRIKSLMTRRHESASDALLEFMTQNYVTLWEEYDIDNFDRNINGVKSQSSEQVFGEYEQFIDRRNPQSPITLYQRHSTRRVSILSVRRMEGDEPGMEVIFEASVESKAEAKKTRWQANIAFQYSGIELDEKIEKVKPVSFVVTQYRTKRLQDVK
jgi:type IV secretory pathway component VirB8